MKVFGLVFLLLTASISNFLIYEKIPLNSYSTKVKKELKDIAALHGLEQLVFTSYDYEKDSIKYTLSLIKSKAVFFNANMLSTTVDTEESLSLSLVWNAREGDTDYLSPYHSIYTAFISKEQNSFKSEVYELQFELEVSSFKFTKTWSLNTEDNFYIPSGSIDNTYVTFKVNCLDKKCPFSNDILLEVVNAFLNDKKSDMNTAFTEKGAEAYYKSLPFGELSQKIYTETSTNIVNENNIGLTLESMPECSASNSDLIFKRKGKLNNLDIEGDDTFSDESSNQKFNINKKLLQNLITENLFNIMYEQANNPSTEYELTVAYLKKITDVSSTYDDSQELLVSAELGKVSFNDEDLSGSIILDVTVLLKDDSKEVFNFTFNMNFKFTPTLLQNGLNFVLLAKNLSVQDISSTKYNIKDENLLNNWIQNTYLVALGNSEFNLFSLSFDLSYYFSSNKLSYEFKDNYLSIIKQ